MNKISIAGCAGRMGRRIAEQVEKQSKIELVGGFEIPSSSFIGNDLGELVGFGKNGVKIAKNIQDLPKTSIIIDFTVPSATMENLGFAKKFNIGMVIGTTGLNDQEKEEIKQASEFIPIVFAPNMGVGINVLLSTVKKIASVLGEGYDVEIIEAHHNKKKDSPSGTALGLAEAVAKGRKVDLKDKATYGRHGLADARQEGEIGIHAIRGGDIIGEHNVMFVGHGEKIEISHSVVTRDVFASGAAKAAAFLVSKKSGLFNMQDVLDLES